MAYPYLWELVERVGYNSGAQVVRVVAVAELRLSEELDSATAQAAALVRNSSGRCNQSAKNR